MKFHQECAACLLRIADEKLRGFADAEKTAEYMRMAREILANADAEHDSAPLMDAKLIRLRRDFLGYEDDYSEIKRSYNALLMRLYDRLRERIDSAEDPLYAAMQISVTGNYIDFNVGLNVTEETLLELLNHFGERRIDRGEYENFRADLEKGGEIIFLHDNCGEVVLDKLLIETIRRLYPDIHAVSVVRQGRVANDVTFEDAEQIGLYDAAEVVGNGTYDIPGTQLDELPPELLARMKNARAILAKGQGNFETMIGCGLNVYYLLLAKCPDYEEWFGMKLLNCIFRNDRNIKR